jgi:hypothetical protein
LLFVYNEMIVFSSPLENANNPVHGPANAGHRVAADGPEGCSVPKGKSGEGLIKAPPATLAGQSVAVHIGVVTSQAYSINQRGDSPQGQVSHNLMFSYLGS